MSLRFSDGCMSSVQVYRCTGSRSLWMYSPLLKHSNLQPEMNISLTADIRSRTHPQTTQSHLCMFQVGLVLAMASVVCGCVVYSLHSNLQSSMYGFSLTADISSRSISTYNSLPSSPMYISNVVLGLALAAAVCGCSLSATTHAHPRLRTFYFSLAPIK